MKYRLFTLLFVFAIIAASCNNSGNSNAAKPDKATLGHRIDSLEKVVYSDSLDLNDQYFQELLTSYQHYYTAFPKDKRTAELKFRAAGLYRSLHQPQKALTIYQDILTDYPKYDKRVETAFLIAFTYDNDLRDKAKATTAYQAVEKEFPGSTWATQAADRLKTINLTDEQLIERFEEKNDSTK